MEKGEEEQRQIVSFSVHFCFALLVTLQRKRQGLNKRSQACALRGYLNELPRPLKLYGDIRFVSGNKGDKLCSLRLYDCAHQAARAAARGGLTDARGERKMRWTDS